MELIVRDINSGKDEIYRDLVKLPVLYKTSSSSEILFVTTNQHKVQELTSQLANKNIKLRNSDLNLPEIQDADPLKIAQDKCQRAFETVNARALADDSGVPLTTVLVEDVCLNFRAMSGLPGPYIKWFVDILKPDGLYKMLQSYEDKSAEAVCTYALMTDRDRVIFCRGSVMGEIVSPIGDSWGWDPCFREPTTGLTFAQMDLEQKAIYSHRSQAIKVLNRYLN